MTKFEEFRFKYPNAFITDGSPYVFVLFGFECSEGWADLLEPVFKYIDEYNTKIVLWKDDDTGEYSVSCDDPWDGFNSSEDIKDLIAILKTAEKKMKANGQ